MTRALLSWASSLPSDAMRLITISERPDTPCGTSTTRDGRAESGTAHHPDPTACPSLSATPRHLAALHHLHGDGVVHIHRLHLDAETLEQDRRAYRGPGPGRVEAHLLAVQILQRGDV